jgi:tyrosinase
VPARVRKDIWDLGDEEDPWRDPAILAYAQAVGAMQALDEDEPENGTNWTNQAAIHERQPGAASDPDLLQDQCQHGGWYFLPWHRMYLAYFEDIVRSHMDPAIAQTWALPYWNAADDPGRRVLPPAFRQESLPADAGGGRNPLFVSQRGHFPAEVNAGEPMSPTAVAVGAALQPTAYTLPNTAPVQGFGGGQTGFHHGARGVAGPLENTPHGAIHVAVGGVLQDGSPDGFMSAFGTAALDPIFWLHHCNLDRLWEVWRRAPAEGHPAGSNPTQPAWLTREFPFFDKTGARVRKRVDAVLDIEEQLGYTYSGLPEPAPGGPRVAELTPPRRPDMTPPELVAATEEPLVLKGATVRTRMTISAPTGPAAQDLGEDADAPPSYLSIDDIEGDRNPGLLYGVFVNIPEGEALDHRSPHYAGTMSLFGIESSRNDDDDDDEEAPHALHYAFDISSLVARLKEENRWDPEHLDVTITPIEAADSAIAAYDIPPVQIGRVSLYVG